MECGDFGGVTAHGNPCTKPAGWGLDASRGPCKHHVGDGGRQPRGESGEAPPPPADLSEESKRVWASVVGEWVLPEEDLLTLRGALESWDLYTEAREQLRRDGPVVVSPDSGAKKRHPAALVSRDAFRDFQQAMRELGLQAMEE